MGAETENILILKQADNYFTVVATSVTPTIFAEGLTRGEALELVASRLLEGKLPGPIRTVASIAAEAKARTKPAEPDSQDRCRAGEYVPSRYLGDDGLGVSYCYSDDGKDSIGVWTEYAGGRGSASGGMSARSWDAARAAWARGGRES